MQLKRCLLLLYVLAFTPTGNTSPYTVAGNYEVYMPPFYWRDHCTQQKLGFGWKLQRRLWNDLGVDFTPLHFTLINSRDQQQFYQRIQRGEIDAFHSMPQTDNDFIRTTNEPFFNPQYALFYKENTHWQYQDWASLNNKKGGWVSANGMDLRSKAFQNYDHTHLKMTVYPSYKDSFGALNRGEIDYIITYRAVGTAVIKHYGYDEVGAAATKGISHPGYLAIAKNSPLAARSDEIDTLLRHYRDAGFLKVLLHSSMIQWLETNNSDCHSPVISPK